jgi:hypothetical protein
MESAIPFIVWRFQVPTTATAVVSYQRFERKLTAITQIRLSDARRGAADRVEHASRLPELLTRR